MLLAIDFENLHQILRNLYGEQMPPYYTERQASYQHQQYPPQDEPTYRPEDYEEYLDFPADMIQTPHYQHQTA